MSVVNSKITYFVVRGKATFTSTPFHRFNEGDEVNVALDEIRGMSDNGQLGFVLGVHVGTGFMTSKEALAATQGVQTYGYGFKDVRDLRVVSVTRTTSVEVTEVDVT